MLIITRMGSFFAARPPLGWGCNLWLKVRLTAAGSAEPTNSLSPDWKEEDEDHAAHFRCDGRATSPGASGDPALNVVKAANQVNLTPTLVEIGPVPSPVVGRDISEQRHFPTDDSYYDINFPAKTQWTLDKVHLPSVMAAAIGEAPQPRLLMTTGYCDLAVDDASYVLAAGVSADRLTFRELTGPHEVYVGAGNSRAFNRALRVFVTQR